MVQHPGKGNYGWSVTTWGVNYIVVWKVPEAKGSLPRNGANGFTTEGFSGDQAGWLLYAMTFLRRGGTNQAYRRAKR